MGDQRVVQAVPLDLDEKEQGVVRQLVLSLQKKQNLAKVKDETFESLRTSGEAASGGPRSPVKTPKKAGTVDLGTAADFTRLHDLVGQQFSEKALTPQEADRRKAMMKRCETAALGIIARVGEEHAHIPDTFQVFGASQRQRATDQLAFLRQFSTVAPRVGLEESLVESVKEDEEEIIEGASTREVSIMVANLIVGNGLLTMPYGFALAGWVAVPVVILTIAVLVFTGILLGSAFGSMFDRGVMAPNFGDISEAAFGTWSRPIFEIFCLGECAFLTIFFFVFSGSSLAPVFGCSNTLAIMGSGILCCLVFLLPRRVFTLLSMVGLGLTFFALGAVVVTGALLLPQFETTQVLATPSWVSGAVGTAAFTALCSGDHAVFGGIYSVAANESAFRGGLIGGFAIFAVVALFFNIVCYATFGNALKPVSLNNIGRDANLEIIPGCAWLFVSANLALTARALLTIPAFSRPLINFCAQALGAKMDMDLSVPVNLESELSLLQEAPKKFGLRMALIGTVIGVAAVSAILLSDVLAALETLTSAFFKTVNCFWLPCCGVWMLCNPSWGRRAAILLVLLPATAWGISGTYSSVQTILSGATPA